MWVATADLPQGGGHPFYERLNQILNAAGFDAFVEQLCAPFYARMGRPSLAPGRYFRLLLVGYFEGLDSERAIAWRAADSLSLRSFLRLAPPASPPDHSTISRTRRLLSVEAHEAVFAWVVQQLADAGLVRGTTVGIDATTLEANAALRSIVRRDTGEDSPSFLTRLAEASGMATPTRAELARFDRPRKKKTSNADWTHPHDPDARVTKMKDGRTHLAHKAEHTVDLVTGAVVGVTVQGADTGDTASMVETPIAAAEGCSTFRFATPNVWPRPGSSPRWAAAATRMTTPWPNPPSVSTRPTSSTVAHLGAPSTQSNWPRSTGSTGSITGASSPRSAMSLRSSAKRSTIAVRKLESWWQESRNSVSGQPGTVQQRARRLGGRKSRCAEATSEPENL